MKPLICPECGGQIMEYQTGATFATCGYCSTKFLIEDTRPAPSPIESPAPTLVEEPPDPTATFVSTLTGVILFIVVIGVVVLISTESKSRLPSGGSSSRATPSPSPASTPDTATLRFGGAGAASGQLQRASSIAVDQQARIYVSDDPMRVQQFDPSGKVLKALTVPARGRNYKGASTVNKIEVGDDGRLFVAVGGVVLVYTDDWAAPPRVIQVAPDYIHDFHVKHDGSVLAVSVGSDDSDEYLLFVNKTGAVTRHIQSFLSQALNSPGTSSELVRLAIDAKGDIFSVYAAGPFNRFPFKEDQLPIAEFTPEAKFVKSLLPNSNAKSLMIGPGERLYIASADAITAYDLDGKALADPVKIEKMNAFTVDKDGIVYTVGDNGVAKYPAIAH